MKSMNWSEFQQPFSQWSTTYDFREAVIKKILIGSNAIGTNNSITFYADDLTLNVGTTSYVYELEPPPLEVWVDDDFDENTEGWDYDRFASIQAAIDGAAPGATIHVAAGQYNDTGGTRINKDGLSLLLADGVIVKNSSPCFSIEADYTRIIADTHAGAKCVPTGGWPGIWVEGYVKDLVIEKLEFDGTGESTGVGIDFQAGGEDIQIIDNYFHDLSEDVTAFYIGGEIYGVFDIQGNMFKDIVGINNMDHWGTRINAKYNSWGAYDAKPTMVELHCNVEGNVCTETETETVDFAPWTHVEVYLESTNPKVDNWPNQVFVGEKITYEVKADLHQVMGAAFELEFPSNLEIVGDPVKGDIFDTELLIRDGNRIIYGAFQFPEEGEEGEEGNPPSGPVDGEELVLFTVTFDAIAVGKGLDLKFDETTDLFSMSPGYGPSTFIYANALKGVKLDVIDRPTLDITGLEDPFYVGVMSHEIKNTLCNPTTGGDWSESPGEPDAIGWIRISNVNLADIASLQFKFGDDWYEFSYQDWAGGTAVQQVGDDVIARFGNYNFGFDIPLQDPQWCDIDRFRVLFTKPGTHDVTVSIYDMMDTPYDYTDDILLVISGPTEITVGDANLEITGTISMQGRTDRSGVPVTLISDLYANITAYSTNRISNNLRFVLNGGYFTFTTLQERYLNVTAALEKLFFVDKALTIPTLELKGGNAYWKNDDGTLDNEIDIGDAGIVGGAYGGAGSTTPTGKNNADVNFDGKVNIQDLALVGGNFGLTSADAYEGWMP